MAAKGIKYMFISKKSKNMGESTEAKLARMLGEFNDEKRPDDGRLVCETQCNMARIRSFSDFMFLMKVRPLQTACYYGAAVFFLLAAAAFWCSEWLLGIIFVVIFLVLATLPHNLRIQYFNRRADTLEDTFGCMISADFSGDEQLVLTISSPQDADLDGAVPVKTEKRQASGSLALHDQNAKQIIVPYSNIHRAYECSHSFYIFPEGDKTLPSAVICDKTQFVCGTPMQLRDRLARCCGKRFKIKVKKM